MKVHHDSNLALGHESFSRSVSGCTPYLYPYVPQKFPRGGYGPIISEAVDAHRLTEKYKTAPLHEETQPKVKAALVVRLRTLISSNAIFQTLCRKLGP